MIVAVAYATREIKIVGRKGKVGHRNIAYDFRPGFRFECFYGFCFIENSGKRDFKWIDDNSRGKHVYWVCSTKGKKRNWRRKREIGQLRVGNDNREFTIDPFVRRTCFALCWLDCGLLLCKCWKTWSELAKTDSFPNLLKGEFEIPDQQRPLRFFPLYLYFKEGLYKVYSNV